MQFKLLKRKINYVDKKDNKEKSFFKYFLYNEENDVYIFVKADDKKDSSSNYQLLKVFAKTENKD